MKKIQIFNYHCNSCEAVFEAPSLSDFSYGEFILWSENGECRYLNVFDDGVYQEIIDLIEQQKPTYLNCEVQSVFGEVACDTDSKGNVFHIGNPLCPICKSDNLTIQKAINKSIDIPYVTHKRWVLLSQEEKRSLVMNACVQSNIKTNNSDRQE
jgi:hypothetical protein